MAEWFAIHVAVFTIWGAEPLDRHFRTLQSLIASYLQGTVRHTINNRHWNRFVQRMGWKEDRVWNQHESCCNQAHDVQGLNDLDSGTFSGYNWQINVLLLSPSQMANTNIIRYLTKKNIHQNPLMLNLLRGFPSFDLAHDLLKYCFGQRSDKLWRPQNTTQTPRRITKRRGKNPRVMIVGWQVRFHAYDHKILMNFVLAFLDGFQQFI